MPRLNMNLKTLDKQNCYQWIKKFKGIKWHPHSLVIEKNHSKRNTFQQLHENSKHCMKFSSKERKSFNIE